jgi:hypothetical protein
MFDHLSKIGVNSSQGSFMVLYGGEQGLYYGVLVM